VHDGPGIRTTVFLKGCPLRCLWCHNPEGMSTLREMALLLRKCEFCGDCARVCPQGAHRLSEGEHTLDRTLCIQCGACIEACLPGALLWYGRTVTPQACFQEIASDRDFFRSSGGGVTFSGGEPLLQADFTAETMRLCRQEGIDTALDTSGAVPWEAFHKVLPYTDRILYDIKHAASQPHAHWTGLGNEGIWENLERLGGSDLPIEIRIPCVPTVNMDENTLEDIARRLLRIPNITGVRPLAYHDFARSKYAALGMEDTMPRVSLPAAEQMDEVRTRLAGYGFAVLT